MKNTNTYKRPYNGNRRNNTQQKPRKNIVEAALSVADSVSDEMYDQICNILASTPFQQLSYPLSCPRFLFDESVTDESKLMTVGYIQSYNPETAKFKIVIFNNVAETINTYPEVVVEPVFITRKDGTLGTITKLNVVPNWPAEESSEGTEEEMTEVEGDTVASEDQVNESSVETTEAAE